MLGPRLSSMTEVRAEAAIDGRDGSMLVSNQDWSAVPMIGTCTIPYLTEVGLILSIMLQCCCNADIHICATAGKSSVGSTLCQLTS